MKAARFFVLVLVLTLLISLGRAAGAQAPQLLGNGGCPPGNDYHPACDVASPLGEINVLDVERVAARWKTTGTFTDAYWSLVGNSGTISTTHFLGTTDNQPLIFKTNGNAAMRIDTDGNVGIGTEGPGAKLTIERSPGSVDHGRSAIYVVDPNRYFDFDGGMIFRGTGDFWSARFTSTNNMRDDGEILGVYTRNQLQAKKEKS